MIEETSLFSTTAYFTIIDLGRRNIKHISRTTILDSDGNPRRGPDGQPQFTITITDHPLDISETNEIIEEANAIWNPGGKLPQLPREAADRFCRMVLLDGNDFLPVPCGELSLHRAIEAANKSNF